PDLLYDIRTVTTTTVKIHSSAYNPVPFPYGYARTVATTDGFNALLRRLISSLPSLAASVPYFLFNVLLDFGYVNLGEDQLISYRLYLTRRAYRPSISPEEEPYFLPFLLDLPLPELLPDSEYSPYGFTSGCYTFYPSGRIERNPTGNPVTCMDEFHSDYTTEFMQQVYEAYESFSGCSPHPEPYSVAGAGVAQYYLFLTEYILRCARYDYCKEYYLNPDGYSELWRRWIEITNIWNSIYDDFQQYLITRVYSPADPLHPFAMLARHLAEFREFQGRCFTYGPKHDFFVDHVRICYDKYPHRCVFSGSEITHFYVDMLFFTPPYSSYLLYHPAVVFGSGCDRFIYSLCSFETNALLVSPHEYAYRWCYGHTASADWVRVPIPVNCDIDWEVAPDIPPEVEPYISPLLDPDFLPGVNIYPHIREAYRKLLRRLSRMRKRLRNPEREIVRVMPPNSFPEVPLVSPTPSLQSSEISYSDGSDTIVLDLTSLEPYILGRLREEAQQSRDIVVSLPSPPRCEEVEERFSLSLRGLIDFFRYSFIAFAVLFGVLSGALGGFSIYLFIRSLSLWRL
ncbi:MAG: hypothetical protein QW328_09895, partial [Nitrososphaerota archaeon]